MAKLTAQQYADKLIQRTSAASGDYSAGIQRVNTSPMAAAAAQVNKWQTTLAAPETKDKYLRGLARTSDTEWKRASIEKGASRLAGGVQASRTKIEAFANSFLPHLDTGVSKVKAMPSDTYEQRKQRAIAMMDHNRSFKR